MQTGEIVSGVITGIKDYGAFVQVEEYCGLIHISEFSDGFVKNISDIVAIGDVVSVEILEVDEEGKKLKLSYKKANVIPSKLLEYVHIYKGFNALELKLNDWIEEAYEKIKKENK
jgi:predicted RNA-binding protein with RPS1 domain